MRQRTPVKKHGKKLALQAISQCGIAASRASSYRVDSNSFKYKLFGTPYGSKGRTYGWDMLRLWDSTQVLAHLSVVHFFDILARKKLHPGSTKTIVCPTAEEKQAADVVPRRAESSWKFMIISEMETVRSDLDTETYLDNSDQFGWIWPRSIKII